MEWHETKIARTLFMGLAYIALFLMFALEKGQIGSFIFFARAFLSAFVLFAIVGNQKSVLPKILGLYRMAAMSLISVALTLFFYTIFFFVLVPYGIIPNLSLIAFIILTMVFSASFVCWLDFWRFPPPKGKMFSI